MLQQQELEKGRAAAPSAQMSPCQSSLWPGEEWEKVMCQEPPPGQPAPISVLLPSPSDSTTGLHEFLPWVPVARNGLSCWVAFGSCCYVNGQLFLTDPFTLPYFTIFRDFVLPSYLKIEWSPNSLETVSPLVKRNLASNSFMLESFHLKKKIEASEVSLGRQELQISAFQALEAENELR